MENYQELLEQELLAYEKRTEMTGAERRALRKWVKNGHSVYEAPESKYLCLYGACPPLDFLDVYRMDREIDIKTHGMSASERTVFLREFL